MIEKAYNPDQHYTNKDLAEFLGVTVHRISQYINKKNIPEKYYEIINGRRYFFKKCREDIKEAIKNQHSIVDMTRHKMLKQKKLNAQKRTLVDYEESSLDEESFLSEEIPAKKTPSKVSSKASTGLLNINVDDIDPEDFDKYRTLEVYFKVEEKKIKVDTLKKENLPAKEVRALWGNHVMAVKSKIKSIKGDLAPLIKEFIPEKQNQKLMMDAIDRTIHDALSDLSK